MEFNKKNIRYAKTMEDLIKALKEILAEARDRGEYIVDRDKCTNFGTIFKDGMDSVSAIDMFCERLFSSRAITMLEKEVPVLSDSDQAIVDRFFEASEYVKTATVSPEDTTAEELENCKNIIETYPELIQKMEPTQKTMELPFYVNPITKEEYPVYCLSNATDENIETWATKLAYFTETFKAIVTPAAFNPNLQPEGLKVLRVGATRWADIVIR